jgi:hypothetical protein
MSAETVLHCAWCDGEGRCGGIAFGCTGPTVEGLCSDCPPVDYPTDETRCAPCPKRAAPENLDKALRDLRDFVDHGKHLGEVMTVTLADAISLTEYIGDGNEALAACQAQSAGRIRVLEAALVHAVSVIQTWHNADIPESQRSELWDIYWRNAPEMKPIREALKEQP